ncbi:MAG TPA: ribose 5-phosphate isomerase B [Blastocatellia bacterium]|nr:ribose 5-phosphate isomerase B [Blastocatellia bacterium]
MAQRIVVGSDHAGLPAKEDAKKLLTELGYEVEDKGTLTAESVDYPDYAEAVGHAVIHGEADLGLLFCGSGIGISMAANKVPGVRAALVWNEETARLAREHNNANVMCMGARTTPETEWHTIIKGFLAGKYLGGRHQQRIDKMAKMDAENHGE